MRSLYGRRFCLDCSAYGTRSMREAPISDAPVSAIARPRAVPGRDEWFFRSLHAVVALLSPQRAPSVARTGVAVFGLSLLLPLLVSSMIPRPSAQTIVAATSDRAATSDLVESFIGPMLVNELPPLPDPIARPVPLARTVAKPTP